MIHIGRQARSCLTHNLDWLVLWGHEAEISGFIRAFIYNFHRAPFLSVFLTRARGKAPESGFARWPYAFVRRSSHPLFRRSEIPKVNKIQYSAPVCLPPPSSYLFVLSVYCSTWNRTVIFTLEWIKGDARPVLCLNLILFPRDALSEKKRCSSFLFTLRRKNAKCNNASGCVEQRVGGARLTPFVENLISVDLFSQANCVVFVGLDFSLPVSLFMFTFICSWTCDHRSSSCESVGSGMGLWACLVGKVNIGNKYLLGCLATCSV